MKKPDKTLYLQCFSGISGDMFCAALIDLGFGIGKVRSEIEKVIPGETALSSRRVMRRGISSVNFNVREKVKGKKYRTLSDIKKIYAKSKLPGKTVSLCMDIFTAVAGAEAKIHGKEINEVHFHEIGAIDSIVDITAAVAGLQFLGIDNVISSPVNLGGGTIKISHGVYPVPAPATLEILKGIPTYGTYDAGELTTPTGAALLKVLCGGYGSMPSGKVISAGYGAGSKDARERANVLRAVIMDTGESDENVFLSGEVMVIETNIDDQDPQSFEYVMEKLFSEGALDVWFTAVMMKKSRPAIKISLICEREKLDSLADILLRETTTFGVRFYEAGRITLERKIVSVSTKYGKVDVKVGITGKDIIKVSPEYESVKKLAKKKDIPIHTLIDEVESVTKNKKFRKNFPVS